jgi:hypothetical protein
LETTLEHGSQEKSDKSPTMPQLENMQLMESRIQVKFLGHILKRWLDSQTALQKNPSLYMVILAFHRFNIQILPGTLPKKPLLGSQDSIPEKNLNASFHTPNARKHQDTMSE